MRPLITSYCRISNLRCIHDGEIVLSDSLNTEELLTQLYRKICGDYPKFFKMDNLAKAGFIGAELILKDLAAEDKEGLTMIVSNRSASLETDLNYQKSVENSFPSPSLFVYTLPNIVLGEIAIRHKCYGEGLFLVSDHLDIENLMTLITSDFERDPSSKIVAGWIECMGGSCDMLLMLIENSISPKARLREDFREDVILKLYE